MIQNFNVGDRAKYTGRHLSGKTPDVNSTFVAYAIPKDAEVVITARTSNGDIAIRREDSPENSSSQMTRSRHLTPLG